MAVSLTPETRQLRDKGEGSIHGVDTNTRHRVNIIRGISLTERDRQGCHTNTQNVTQFQSYTCLEFPI